jgi:quinol monooxygenase YgiN
MSRIIFEINYDITPDKREDYLSIIKELESHIRTNSNKNYMVVEDKNKKNNFTEIYICENEDEYENLENDTDERTFELTNKLFSEYILNKKANYSTFYEIE